MSNKQSNYPTAQMNRSVQQADGFIADTVSCISELAACGKPKDAAELKRRIGQYFDFCADRNFRPGIESLSLALGVNRTTFWHWCNSEYGVSEEWADVCKQARQSIVAFVEAAANSGHLSPPIAIFSLKNLANWKDTVSFEDVTPLSEERQRALDFDNLSAYRLPVLEDESDPERQSSESNSM